MELKEILLEGSKEIGVELSDLQIGQFLKYKDLLLQWNENINLTAITEETEVIIKHFIDSLTVLKFIDLSNKSVIDVGTGAGFPGLPLKIVNSSIRLTLLDSLNKRINFLNEVAANLSISGVENMHGRAEDIAVKKEYRENFDYCIPRAVANLSTLAEYCLPFVKIGGYFISMKGPEIDEELNEAKKAINVLGGEVEKIEKIQLPFTDIVHSLVFIKKLRHTPTQYPRKAGKPSKEPIK